MDPTVASPLIPSSRPIYSCVRCSDRKVKCDRQKPCGACVKQDAQCVFRPFLPSRKRQKRARDDVLTDRLKRYEALLQEQGIDPARLSDTLESEQRRTSSHATLRTPDSALQLPTPASVNSEPEQSINKTQLLHGQGQSKFVDNTLWTRVVEEFHDPEEALEDSSNTGSDAEASEENFDFVAGVVSKSESVRSHPPAEHIHDLWQIFTENVDPLTKIVHVPTLRPAIHKATTEIESVPKSFEALMFAIYSAAVMSLKDDECKRRFGEPRRTLLSRYTSATKAALARAKFMGTTSIVVLQALMLHLLSVRDRYGPRALWTLTGVAVRIAEAMGLHRDGTLLGLPPFEAEIRRRIWWHLKMNDFRAAELSGLAKFRGIDTDFNMTKLPANINDDQLYPGMSHPAIESTKPTDMIFSVLRSELGKFAATNAAKFREQEKNGGLWDEYSSKDDMNKLEGFITEVEEGLETKFLRYCDPSIPLHLMTLVFARSSVNVGYFIVHHPRRWASQEKTPESERLYVWDVSIRVLEQYEMVHSNRQLQRFAWHTHYFLQWHAFIHVLDTLRADPLMPDAVRAWQLIDCVYENHPDLASNTKKTVQRALGNLCLKAFDARKAALRNQGDSALKAPEYIKNLRQQREAAKSISRRRAGDTVTADTIPHYSQPNAHESMISSHTGIQPSMGHLGSYEPNQDIPLQLANFDPASIPVNAAQFWYTNNFDNGLLDTSNGPMNVDPDFMLDQSFDNTMGQNINWTQWDAWLGDSNMAA